MSNPETGFRKFHHEMQGWLCCSKNIFNFSMETCKKYYRLDEEIRLVLKRETGISRSQFKDIEGELVRVITIKTTGGKVKTYTDSIKKFQSEVQLSVNNIFTTFKFSVPFKKHQNVSTCISKFLVIMLFFNNSSDLIDLGCLITCKYLFKVQIFRNQKILSKISKGLEGVLEILIYQQPQLINSNFLDPGDPKVECKLIQDRSLSKLLMSNNAQSLLPESYINLEKSMTSKAVNQIDKVLDTEPGPELKEAAADNNDLNDLRNDTETDDKLLEIQEDFNEKTEKEHIRPGLW